MKRIYLNLKHISAQIIPVEYQKSQIRPTTLSMETKKLHEILQEAAEAQNHALIIEALTDMHAADISLLLEEIDIEQGRYILELLEPQRHADVLCDMDEDIRKEYLEDYSEEILATLLELSDSDDAADILNELPLKRREGVIANIKNQETVDHIIDLLHYDEDCAGGLMAKELIKAHVGWTVKQCIEEIRRQAENVEKIYTVYVVGDHDILLGRVSLKKIILSKDETLIKDIYVPEIANVFAYQEGEEVAAIMSKYDLEVIPVVNIQGKLLGRITIDDIFDVVQEQAELDQQMMAGISENIEQDDSIWMLSRARLPWLLIGMVGGLLGARFIGIFEAELSIIPAMAFFIPLITATGGNVGIQSSTIVVQALAHATPGEEPEEVKYGKVLAVALINGLVIGSLVFFFNFFFTNISLAFTVSVALFSVVMLASFMGTITPIILDRFGINPALASGPFITTANDLLGLAVYFVVAKMILDAI